MAKHSKEKGRGQEPEPEPAQPIAGGDRRDFVTKTTAVVAGAVCGIVPAAAGLYTFLDPIRERQRATPAEVDPQAAAAASEHGRWLKVAKLAEVKQGGEPRSYPAVADSWDAWNYYPPHPIGAIFLHWPADAAQPVAFTATCPHLGCFVDYAKAKGCFSCPCHNSEFDLSGKMLKGPPPRGMDSLEVEIRNGDEVWVQFQKFRAGEEEKVPE